MTPILNAIICDDEPPARRLLGRMLADMPDVRVLSDHATAADALQAIETGGVDLVFMDVEMPELSGVDAASRIEVDRKPLIVFTTAHPEYAVDAFGIDAIDYVLKPFDRTRLRQAIDKAARLHRLIRTRPEPAETRRPDGEARPVDSRINLQDGAGSHFLETSDIVWVEAAGDYSVIHKTGAELVLRRTLSSLAEVLPDRHFARVHRSSIVGLAHVEHIRRRAKGEAELTLSTGTQVRASRSYRDTVARLLERL
ncbi:MAG: LytTR family DNA-binding domain-containing protein [Litorimonas sp.]